MAQESGIDGSRVLLVEDESLVSMLAEDILLEAGCTVLLAGRLREALELAATEDMDLAVLDVNLGGGDTSFPVADILLGRDIPFVFATGYAAEGLEPRYAKNALIQKPYAPHSLVAALAAAIGKEVSHPG
jgi:CheY-like chemotaxis protein